ncbi:MAG TPA: type III-B CRISPR module-associated Cmr3 family protein [Terriglobales bacterium]|nr:type III-B CRISPR module-associated Cmr3 family protein [Terriglobales bacterium]
MRTLALVPRDGFFCKDGRGWHTSASGRGHGLDWPWPSTLLGALRSAWGRGEEGRVGEHFGPRQWVDRTREIRLGRTLMLRRPLDAAWDGSHRVWPVPCDALWTGDGLEAPVARLDPVPPAVPTLGRDDDGVRENLWRPVPEDAGKPARAPRYWGEADLVDWLTGQPAVAQRRGGPLEISRRFQTHVAVAEEELTAADEAMFSHDVVETLELRAEWAVGAEASLPGDELPEAATLGSDSRICRIEALPPTMFDAPKLLLDAFRTGSRGLRIIVVAPTCFRGGWLPDGFAVRGREYCGQLPGVAGEVALRAAFVPRPLCISGWDVAAGAPKPASRMVAPGAVYFFERLDRKAFGDVDARSLWLAAMGARNDEGFGRVVPGAWSPRGSDQ